MSTASLLPGRFFVPYAETTSRKGMVAATGDDAVQLVRQQVRKKYRTHIDPLPLPVGELLPFGEGRWVTVGWWVYVSPSPRWLYR